MCAYLANIVDIEALTPEQEQALTAYLKDLREKTEKELKELSTRLNRIKKDQTWQRKHAKRRALRRQGLKAVG